MAMETTNLDQKPVLAVGRSYDFGFVRQAFGCAGIREGIATLGGTALSSKPGDLAVSTAGSTLTMNIAAGRAWVRGDTSIASHLSGAQGSYFCYVSTAQTVTLDTAHATLPRIDRVILRVYDSDVDGSGQIKWAVEKVSGTPTASAQVTNPQGASYLAGAATVPDTAFLLANIRVPAASTPTTADIEDTRTAADYAPSAGMAQAGALSHTSNNAFLKITYDTLLYDNIGMADTTNDRFNIKQAGKYLCISNVGWASNSTGIRGQRFEKNSAGTSTIANTIGMRSQQAAASAAQVVHSITAGRFAVGDAIELFAVQNSGGTLAYSGNGETYLAIAELHWIGD